MDNPSLHTMQLEGECHAMRMGFHSGVVLSDGAGVEHVLVLWLFWGQPLVFYGLFSLIYLAVQPLVGGFGGWIYHPLR